MDSVTFSGKQVLSASDRWPLERVLFALAGATTLTSAILAAMASKWFLLLTAVVGVNQGLYVLVAACPASIILRRACHLRSAIYANTTDMPGARPVPRPPVDPTTVGTR